jgi:hypothetical protein
MTDTNSKDLSLDDLKKKIVWELKTHHTIPADADPDEMYAGRVLQIVATHYQAKIAEAVEKKLFELSRMKTGTAFEEIVRVGDTYYQRQRRAKLSTKGKVEHE